MIKLNQNLEKITLKAIKYDDIKNELIIKENGATTLISEESTIYVAYKKFETRKQITDIFKKAISSLEYNVNIDTDSFLKLTKEPELLLENIFELAAYVNHEVIFYKKENKSNVKDFNFLVKDTKIDFENIFKIATVKAKWINFARDLQDTPPNIATASYLANKIIEAAKPFNDVKVTVLTKKEIEQKNMNLILAVNAASYEEPRVVTFEYNNASNKPKTGLVGKGITFDSGGYSLKPSNFMEGMKFDMSGAVIMLCTVLALAELNAEANVVAVGTFTDNRIGGKGTLVESIVSSYNGKTVEIANTDAEGRLVLADGITYAIRDQKADRIIDAATLTGSIVIALGKWATGAFSKDDNLWNELHNASKISQEQVWRMPLFEEHLEVMQRGTVIADLTNAEKGREAGSSTAAAFLDSFCEGKPFLHLDIAGTADKNNRGTGVMISTLFEMLSK